MKKISILFYLVLSVFTYLSCEQQDEISLSKSVDSQITIDENSQVALAPTVLTKDQIENDNCGDLKITTLFAGQHIEVGDITISNNKHNLFVTYNVKGDWWLEETHLFVGIEANLPLNGSGNPKIGHFPYHGDHDLTQSYTFTIPLDQLEECYIISTHAVVVKKENGDITSSETAFGFGEKEFPGNRWGWYSEHCNQSCDNDNGDDDDDDNDDDDDDDDDDSDDNSNDDDNNDDDDNSNDNTEDTCLSAFAYNATFSDKSYCFDFTDSSQNPYAGWSNEFNFYLGQDKHYTLPLYAKVDNCSTNLVANDNIIKIGYVDIFIFIEGAGDGGQLFTTVKYVITDNTYELSDVNLYLEKNIKYPSDLNPSNGDYNYNNTSSYWNSNNNTFENLPWPGSYNNWDTYFIPNVTICKK